MFMTDRAYNPPECHPAQQAYTFLIRILSTSFISVSIFSVCCYSRVSLSVGETEMKGGGGVNTSPHVRPVDCQM